MSLDAINCFVVFLPPPPPYPLPHLRTIPFFNLYSVCCIRFFWTPFSWGLSGNTIFLFSGCTVSRPANPPPSPRPAPPPAPLLSFFLSPFLLLPPPPRWPVSSRAYLHESFTTFYLYKTKKKKIVSFRFFFWTKTNFIDWMTMSLGNSLSRKDDWVLLKNNFRSFFPPLSFHSSCCEGKSSKELTPRWFVLNPFAPIFSCKFTH